MIDEKEYKDLEQIADFFITYYQPFQMIEHKYKTKITAIGLLKKVDRSDPIYIDPYYQRLKSYKGLIKDHTDNFKLASDITIDILSMIIKNLFVNFLRDNKKRDCILLNNLIALMFSKHRTSHESVLRKLRKPFVMKYKTNRAIQYVAEYLLKRYLNSPRKYDMLADIVVKKCLTGVTQEEVMKEIGAAAFNFFIYGIYSRAEVTNIYTITLKTEVGLQQMKYFTKIKSLARAVINMVGDKKTTVNFFGKLFDSIDTIKKLFTKYSNIKVMFY